MDASNRPRADIQSLKAKRAKPRSTATGFVMRFAFIATCAAAVVGAPLVAAAATARMDADQFLTAVRCAAYESAPALAGENADIAAVRMQLNAEARRQAPEIAAQARADVVAIAHDASAADADTVRNQRNIACAGGAGMIADNGGEAV